MPMKRITLFAMLFALLGVVAFAQNNQKGNAQSQRSAFKCIDRHALSAPRDWQRLKSYINGERVYLKGMEPKKDE